MYPVSATLDDWHYRVFRGLPPIDYYAGNMRGDYEDKPCLAVDVEVAGILGVRYTELRSHTSFFDQVVDALLDELDQQYATASPDDDLDFLFEAVAWITTDFIRIHPYLNGNGRLSRIISNALLYRYGFRIDSVRVNPRPNSPYGRAGREAMLGNHLPMRDYLISCVNM